MDQTIEEMELKKRILYSNMQMIKEFENISPKYLEKMIDYKLKEKEENIDEVIKVEREFRMYNPKSIRLRKKHRS
jgi:hypothetical protein